MFPGAMAERGANTQNSVIRGSNLKEHKPLFCISINVSDTFKTHMKQNNHSFCVTVSRKEKDGAQPIISYGVYLIMTDVSFSYHINNFVLVSAQLKCWILFQGVSDASKIVIYHISYCNHWKFREKKVH